MYQIIKKKKIWLSISLILCLITGIAFFWFGLKLGIDFTGGSLLEVKFIGERPAISEVYRRLSQLETGSLVVLPSEENSLLLRFQDSSEAKHQEVINALKEMVGSENLEEKRYESVGPSIGQELRRKSIYSILLVLIGILVYISLAFRKVSKPVASWKYGAVALLTLMHDTIITLGIFALLGRFLGVEVNSSFVAAILTVVGYSVHDTIVVFDRIRENLPKSEEDFAGTVNISVNQTLGRSINTSLTTMLTLCAIIFFGGESTKYFALALAVGIFFGTYSSIFLASPFLVLWDDLTRRKNI